MKINEDFLWAVDQSNLCVAPEYWKWLTTVLNDKIRQNIDVIFFSLEKLQNLRFKWWKIRIIWYD